MDRGWVKLWRKSLDSEIWDMPPVYLKVWTWLLLNCDKETGTIQRSAPQIADAVQWVENNRVELPDKVTVNRILHWFAEKGMLVTCQVPGLSRRQWHISICQWETYQGHETGACFAKNTGLFREISENRVPPPVSPPCIPLSSPPLREQEENLRVCTAPAREELDQERQEEQELDPPFTTTPADTANDRQPTDPGYVFDPRYSGHEHLALWQQRVGRLDPTHHMGALNAFLALHGFYKRSRQQINAMVMHIATDPEAKRYWGSNPAKLIVLRDGNERSFERLEHHMRTSAKGANVCSAALGPKPDTEPPPTTPQPSLIDLYRQRNAAKVAAERTEK